MKKLYKVYKRDQIDKSVDICTERIGDRDYYNWLDMLEIESSEYCVDITVVDMANGKVIKAYGEQLTMRERTEAEETSKEEIEEIRDDIQEDLDLTFGRVIDID
jgi:hypothetical protein